MEKNIMPRQRQLVDFNKIMEEVIKICEDPNATPEKKNEAMVFISWYKKQVKLSGKGENNGEGGSMGRPPWFDEAETEAEEDWEGFLPLGSFIMTGK